MLQIEGVEGFERQQRPEDELRRRGLRFEPTAQVALHLLIEDL